MRGAHLEPFTGPELARWLLTERDAVFVRSTGGHRTYELPSGAHVGAPDHGYVTRPLSRQVAQRCGITYAELRLALGHPLPGTRRTPRHKPSRTEPRPGVRKAEVVAQATEVRSLLERVERHLRRGHRDPEHYRRFYVELVATRNILSRALAEYVPFEETG